jgi:hypothetical protein
MSSPTRTHRLVWRTATLLVPMLFMSAATAASSSDWQSRVTPRLLALWTQAQGEPGEKTEGRGAALSGPAPLSPARFDQAGRVQLDVHFDCSTPAPTKTLAAAGLLIGAVVRVAPLCSVEGWLQPGDLPDLAARSAVRSVDLPTYSRIIRPVMHSLGQAQAVANTVIDGSAVSIMHADQYIQTTGKNGAGITIGVMSDDVTSLAIIQSRGELPAHISILTPAQQSPNPTPTDEGTMLLEEMHAVAPGASLAFCAPQTDVEYVSCLRDLIAAGASVVADDIEYPAEDAMSTQSALAQGVQSLLTQNANVMLFSAAGNENESFWQGAYAPTQLATPFTCGGQADAYAQTFDNERENETMQLLDTLSAPIFLQWADPFGQNSSNFDLYVLDQYHSVIKCLAGAGRRNTFVVDANPNLAGSKYHFVIATPGTEFAGKFLKLLVYGDGAATFSSQTPGGIASPQKLLSRVVTVGAVYGADGVGSIIEPFSATGPVQLEFPMPSSLQAPVLVAPDAIYVDSNNTKFAPASDGFFYGTSASTPNVAAVAALVRATFPTLSAQRIASALTSGAVPLGTDPAPDGVFGYGRVDAVGALQTLARPTISHIANITIVGGTSSRAVAVTLGGTGNLKLAGTSDNTSLVSFTASGEVRFAPTTCGSSTDSCTLTITPALGQVGTAHLAISATDGAGRSTSTSVTVTVSEPPPPTVSITAGNNQSLQPGTTASPVTLSLNGTKPLTISIASSNAALLPASSATLSSGCGSSSLSCNVSLRPIAGQLGQATLTVTAHDPYGQTAQSTLGVTIVAAPAKSGGGGAFDFGSLIMLGMLFTGSVMRARAYRLLSRSGKSCGQH